MALWLALKLLTILLSASPLMPDIACHHVTFAAGLTSLPGARALWSPGGLAAPPLARAGAPRAAGRTPGSPPAGAPAAAGHGDHRKRDRECCKLAHLSLHALP